MESAVRTKSEILGIYNRHVETVYRVCFSFMKSPSETEAMVQETFMKLMVSGKTFESERHEKAWLIVTASNTCKDSLRKQHQQANHRKKHGKEADQQASSLYCKRGKDLHEKNLLSRIWKTVTKILWCQIITNCYISMVALVSL